MANETSSKLTEVSSSSNVAAVVTSADETASSGADGSNKVLKKQEQFVNTQKVIHSV